MAGNKFATMLQKNCHKTVVILVYAVLEWILILLLLLNSLFSYLIGKFAKYFGLRPFCRFCCRLDLILDSKKKENSHRDHVCEAHGDEISKLSYCFNHQRLAESRDLCSDCSSSRPTHNGPISEISSTIAFLTRATEGTSENDEEIQCSCCDEILSRKLYSPSMLFKPSWDVLDYIQKKAFIAEVIDADNIGEQDSDTTTQSKSLSQADQMNHEIDQFEEKGGDDGNDEQEAFGKENQLHSDGSQKSQFVEGYCCPTDFTYKSTDDPLWSPECNQDDESLYITDMLLQNAEYIDSDRFICIELIDTAGQKPLTDSSGDIEEEHEDKQVPSVVVVKDHSEEYMKRDEDIEECKKLFSDVEFAGPSRERNSAGAAGIEGPNNFPDKQINEEKVRSGMEDSFDGSVISEMEVDDETLTTEHLKTKLIAQKKALNALYAELEEERKAAAVAANETMAMITKLQEEKALGQLEALQYQRMMEEQAEYDQEALQLLNDLMMKREKEKQELEKELEIYRNKVLDYEAEEKMAIVRSRKGSVRNTHSSTSSDGGLEDLEEMGEECITDLNMPDISLTEFDEERESILEELKVLEAKLFALHDSETQRSEEVTSFEHLTNSNVEDFDPQGKNHFERKTIDLMAKKLLPLFEATDNEFGEEEFDKEEINNHLAGTVRQFFEGTELEKSKLFIQEELGHVYERLQALEADKEFLKHCIRSMMKGNKGVALLQEILQHLRDLRSAELSARNLSEIPFADVSLDKEDEG